jgi:aspartate/methionine/tyrosine aminotransferase
MALEPRAPSRDDGGVTDPGNYLAFARAHFGRARHDFALSGEHAPRCLVAPRGEGRGALTPLTALEALREDLAAFLGRPVAEVVPCLGTSQAMALAAACLRGVRVGLEAPVYEPLRLAFEGSETVRITRSAATGFTLEAAALGPAVTATEAIVFAEPHNPTGARTDPAALRAALADFRGTVIVDEVYAPFDRYVNDEGTWPGQGRDLHPNAWAIGSLTKAYGLGPYRVGWLVVPAHERARVDEAVIRAVGELPLHWALEAREVLRQVPALARELRETLPERRALVLACVKGVAGLEVHEPPSGPYVWVRVPEGRDVRAAVERWASELGLVASPGVFFGDARGLRLSWTAPLDRLRAGLPVLEHALRALVAGT